MASIFRSPSENARDAKAARDLKKWAGAARGGSVKTPKLDKNSPMAKGKKLQENGELDLRDGMFTAARDNFEAAAKVYESGGHSAEAATARNRKHAVDVAAKAPRDPYKGPSAVGNIMAGTKWSLPPKK